MKLITWPEYLYVLASLYAARIYHDVGAGEVGRGDGGPQSWYPCGSFHSSFLYWLGYAVAGHGNRL